jgi:hypothetical protein
LLLLRALTLTYPILSLSQREYVLKADTSAACSAWVEHLRLSQFHVVQTSLASHQGHLHATQGRASTLEAARDDAVSEVQSLRHQLAAAEALSAAQAQDLEQLRAQDRLTRQLALLAVADLEREKAGAEASLAQAMRERELLLAAKGIRTQRPPDLDAAAATSELPAERPFRMWVGTWNVGANEPFDTGSGLGTRLLRESFLTDELPADLYLLGMQEGASESVFSATEALTATLAGCERVPLSEAAAGDKGDGGGGGGGDGGGDKGAWTDKIHGRGDGSLMGTKFTGLALYVRRGAKAQVRVLGCVAHPLEKLGSKGGVAVALAIRGATVVFVTCHLEAAKRDTRRLQVRELLRELGDKLGHPGFGLTAQFHHVVWCGDLNYRCVEADGAPMAADKCGAMLRAGQNGALFSDHDQLNQERRAGEAFAGFREPTPHPEFYPTYKKLENRAGPTDYAASDWVAQVYRLRYKEPIYKGGHVKERTPGYTDRILYHSLGDLAGCLEPERRQVAVELLAAGRDPPTPAAVEVAECDNYCSVNDGVAMSVSDHSPVFATFLLSSPRRATAASAEAPTPEDSVLDSPTAQIEVIALQLKGNVETTGFDLVFPAPFEVPDGLAQCHCRPQANGWREEPTRPKTDCRHFAIDQGKSAGVLRPSR